MYDDEEIVKSLFFIRFHEKHGTKQPCEQIASVKRKKLDMCIDHVINRYGCVTISLSTLPVLLM